MDGQNSLKFDLIVSWPRHMDYPLWREQIKDNRGIFEKVIVVFTNMNVHKDYRDFIRVAMKEDDITFLDSPKVLASEDWRNVAVNTGLNNSHSKWVWFTEQDFFWKDGFWPFVYNAMSEVSVVSALVEGRLHPCSIFVTRDVINTHTRRDFSVCPDVGDHFSKFQDDLFGLARIFILDSLYTHLGGLSQNMFLMHDRSIPLYYPEEFEKYVWKCLNVRVPLHRDFEEAFKNFLEGK